MRNDPRRLTEDDIKIILGAELTGICPSTNDIAKGYIASGIFDRFVFASRQTMGRGSRDRVFASAPGGIYMSYAFMPDVLAEEYGLYVLAAGVAVCRVLAGYCFDAYIKYPNDVIIGGKKVCGILLENIFFERSGSVLGIGLNVYNDITDISNIACSLSSERSEFCIPLAELAKKLADELRSVCTNPRECLGDYRLLCKTLGQEVTLIAQDKKTRGIAEDFDDAGRLIIRTKDKERIIVAGGETVISGAANVSIT